MACQSLFSGKKKKKRKNIIKLSSAELAPTVVMFTPSKVDRICPLAIPNQISTISMQIRSLVKIDVYPSYHPEMKYGWMNVRLTDGRTNINTDIQLETIIPLHYRVAEYKKQKNIINLSSAELAQTVLMVIIHSSFNCLYMLSHFMQIVSKQISKHVF